MAKLPQIENTQPITEAQPINSTAKSSDAFAQYMGNLAKQAENALQQEVEFQSQSQLIMTQNQLADVAKDAQIKMINHPDQALAITKDTQDNFEAISKNSYVNRKDRLRLEQIATTYNNHIELQGAKVAHQQSLVDIQHRLSTEVPAALLAIDQFYSSGNSKAAEERQKSLMQAAGSAVKSGAISYAAYDKISNGVKETIDRALVKAENLKLNNLSPEELHKTNLTPYGTVNNNLAELPSSQYTNHNSLLLNEDTAWHQIQSDIVRYGHMTRPELLNLIPSMEKQQKINLMLRGSMDAKAMISSDAPDFQIKHQIDELKFKKESGGVLNTYEKSKLDYTEGWYKRLASDYNSAMLETSKGQVIHQQRISSDKAIENSPNLSPEQKLLKRKENDDWENIQLINLGFAKHLDPRLINPMTAEGKEAMIHVKTAFQFDQDPSLVTKIFAAASKELKPYMANALPEYHQKAVAYIIGNAQVPFTEGFANQLIKYNQERPEGVPKITDGLTEKYKKNVPNLIEAQLSDVFNYIRTQPDGVNLSLGMKKALANYVYGESQRTGDTDLNNASSIISKIGDEIKKSYNIYTDRYARINNTTLNLDNRSLEAISNYAATRAFAKAKDELGHMEYLEFVDNHNVMLINQGNNVFTLINPNTGAKLLGKDGTPLFEESYTEILREAALKSYVNAADRLSAFVTGMQANRKSSTYDYLVGKVK